MENKTKSFSNFIKEVVDKFEYEDFQPNHSPENLKLKFQEKICFENAYWSPMQMPPAWRGNCLALNFKSFNNLYESVTMVIRIDRQHINLILVDDNFYGTDYQYKSNISIKEIWMDHSKLNNFFAKYFGAAIEYANRSDGQTIINWN